MDNITENMSEVLTSTFYPTTFNLSLLENTTVLLDSDNITTPLPYGGRGLPSLPIGYYGEMRFILYKTLLPIIISVGTVGNLLTVLVLLREWKTFSSTSMYLMVLAISDTGFLYTAPLRDLIYHNNNIDIRTETDAGCKLSAYFTYACSQLSAWILVAVNLERAASVVVPHKVKLGCTLKTACIVIASMFITLFGINIVNLVNFGLKSNRCNAVENIDFVVNIWPYMFFMLVYAIPFVILLFCNIIIIVHLQKSREKRKRMTASQGQQVKTSGRDPTSLSVLLIVLCVVFFLCMTPLSVFSLYYPRKYFELMETIKTDPIKASSDYQFLHYQRAIVNIVGYTNASVNFIMYVFSGTKFRNGLFALFTNRKSDHQGIFRHAPNV